MTSDQVFNPSFWYIFLALMAVSLPLYIFVLWKSWKLAIAYLLLNFVLVVYVAFFSVHNFGGAFGAGMALSCLSTFLVPVSLIIWILLRHLFQHKFGADLIRRRMYFFGGLLIIVYQLFPFSGSYFIDSTCFRNTQSNAESIIRAVETYQQENGAFPQALELLQIEYLSEIPTPGCTWLGTQDYRPKVSFEIQTCNDGTVLLINESTDGTSMERYNFATGNWSSVSFLDGTCSYLH